MKILQAIVLLLAAAYLVVRLRARYEARRTLRTVFPYWRRARKMEERITKLCARGRLDAAWDRYVELRALAKTERDFHVSLAQMGAASELYGALLEAKDRRADEVLADVERATIDPSTRDVELTSCLFTLYAAQAHYLESGDLHRATEVTRGVVRIAPRVIDPLQRVAEGTVTNLVDAFEAAGDIERSNELRAELQWTREC